MSEQAQAENPQLNDEQKAWLTARRDAMDAALKENTVSAYEKAVDDVFNNAETAPEP